MTRFARARGSKSSNERAPDDGTPWEVMKEQMLQAKLDGEDAKNRKEAEKQRLENYEKFLKDHKVQKRTATWCDFPEEGRKHEKESSITQSEEHQVKKKKKKSKLNAENELVQFKTKTNDVCESNITRIDSETVSPAKKSKKNNKQKDQTPTEPKSQSTEINSPLINEQEAPKKKKKKNKKGKPTDSVVSQSEDNSQMETTHHTVNPNDENDNVSNKQSKKLKKKKNKSVKTTSSPIGPNSEINTGNIDETKETTSVAKIQKSKKKKNKQLVNGQPVRRKEINDNSFQLIINGKDVELVRFDGFPIMRKDAERLAELKSSMIKKGIPKSEVQRTMKLERRRAEKALARLKRDVCYNCRKGGHNLSDCPDLKSKIPGVDAAEGVCFKCGSTEHRQFECKVQRDKEFRFATCFICKEPGHIARQCPDNPKGLYPNGGGCKLCGDVTHLRKDCPTIKDKKEETSVKLQTLDSSDNIEDIRQETKQSAGEESAKKPKKIKF